MELRQLRIENLRAIGQLDVEFGPRWNLLTGDNGAGKTTILEAAFLLSHGRSFRAGAREALVRHGAVGYSVFGTFHGLGTVDRVGLARAGSRTEARLDGAGVGLGELMRHSAVLCFEPGSHELIAGASEERRRFLDWGVFHVEHDFLAIWRRYQRALKQRNALLRSAAAEASLDAWDAELSEAATPLSAVRQRYFDTWAAIAAEQLAALLAELGEPRLVFDPGHDAQVPLAESLRARRDRDLARGYTSRGPHRADWSVSFAAAPRREHLSRGQEKLCAFACVLAQARLFERSAGQWPVVCVDDLAAEVDLAHQALIVDALDATGAQLLVTGTQPPAILRERACPAAMFHVEQGRMRSPLL